MVEETHRLVQDNESNEYRLIDDKGQAVVELGDKGIPNIPNTHIIEGCVKRASGCWEIGRLCMPYHKDIVRAVKGKVIMDKEAVWSAPTEEGGGEKG